MDKFALGDFVLLGEGKSLQLARLLLLLLGNESLKLSAPLFLLAHEERANDALLLLRVTVAPFEPFLSPLANTRRFTIGRTDPRSS